MISYHMFCGKAIPGINGAVAQHVQQFKMRKYAQDFQPLVFETFWYWSEEVGVSICHQMKILQELRTHLQLLGFQRFYSRNAITIVEREDFAKLQG